MAQSLYFYDLETSGINAREDRIMQFAGQRTDLELNPIGKPHNILVKLTDDVLPDPYAILITGITPQQTIAEGITDSAFLKVFHDEIATEGTIFVGYNTIRFDDEFMRYLNYRNFYDAYEWQWKDGRSRWDLLDVMRMTRALRPDGIEWPFNSDGQPSNRLELLTNVNNLEHSNAHDALADVTATIALAELVKTKQPKLYEYLFSMRGKQAVSKLVDSGEPFVYTSGRYRSEFEKTTIAVKLTDHPTSGALVYDLRVDPDDFANKTPDEIAEIWKWKKEPTEPRLPVKALAYNRCPAVAPLGVLDDISKKRLQIDLKKIETNLKKLRKHKDFAKTVFDAAKLMKEQRQTTFVQDENDVDSQLYDKFIPGSDKPVMSMVRAADPKDLVAEDIKFKDSRLTSLLPLYKARNFPDQLSAEERTAWEEFRHQRLFSGGESSKLARFGKQLHKLTDDKTLTQKKQHLLEDLRLYGESVVPAQD